MGKKIDKVVDVFDEYFRFKIKVYTEKLEDLKEEDAEQYEIDDCVETIEMYESEWEVVLTMINDRVGTTYLTDKQHRDNELRNAIMQENRINRIRQEEEQERIERERDLREKERLDEERRWINIMNQERERQKQKYNKGLTTSAKVALGTAGIVGGFAAGRAFGKKLM